MHTTTWHNTKRPAEHKLAIKRICSWINYVHNSSLISQHHLSIWIEISLDIGHYSFPRAVCEVVCIRCCGSEQSSTGLLSGLTATFGHLRTVTDEQLHCWSTRNLKSISGCQTWAVWLIRVCQSYTSSSVCPECLCQPWLSKQQCHLQNTINQTQNWSKQTGMHTQILGDMRSATKKELILSLSCSLLVHPNKLCILSACLSWTHGSSSR